MAIKVYECTECQHEEEVLQDSKGNPRDPEPKCSECGGELKKVEGRIEATRFELKGSCWANNGYSK